MGDAAARHHAKVADVANVHVGSPRRRYSRPRRHLDVAPAGRRVGQDAGSWNRQIFGDLRTAVRTR
jgi:hypothetical protein